ncbi:MAG: hypothetical protein ACXWQO_04915 [Bdellovibrionota bacterium]
MKNIFAVVVLNLLALSAANANVLPPSEADAICHKKAVRSARFLAETRRNFLVSYKAADVAEISTQITYEFHNPGLDEALFTVVAYAYPDTKSCLIGSITNNIAGND